MTIAEIAGVGSLPVLLAYHINLLRDLHEAAWLAGRRPRIEEVLTLEAGMRLVKYRALNALGRHGACNARGGWPPADAGPLILDRWTTAS
jgi:hypothetical protein